MGIPKGITLIVGGGYHGKSTLLNALELGIYNHILGDGREFVITRQDAVKVRAEDGRSERRSTLAHLLTTYLIIRIPMNFQPQMLVEVLHRQLTQWKRLK